jgi:putative sterol carrier protein
MRFAMVFQKNVDAREDDLGKAIQDLRFEIENGCGPVGVWFLRRSMKVPLYSEEWAKSAAAVIAGSDSYRNAAKTWEGGMVFTLQADPSLGVPENRSVFFDLWHGECRDGRSASAADLEVAAYIISADAFTWRQVMEGKLEPIAGLMRGKLKLARGNMAVLARFVLAAKELVRAATQVETEFPGE